MMNANAPRTNSTFVEFNPVLGKFHKLGDKKAVQDVARPFGDAWKAGFTGYNTGVTKEACEKLKSQGVALGDTVSGTVTSVVYDEGTDGKNVYRKARIFVTNPEGNSTLSIPLNTDEASRLIPKLAAAIGKDVIISLWKSLSEEKNGKRYIDTGCSVKSAADKVEISSAEDVVTGLKSVEASIKEKIDGVLTGADATKAVRNAKEKFFAELLQSDPRFNPESTAKSPAASEETAY